MPHRWFICKLPTTQHKGRKTVCPLDGATNSGLHFPFPHQHLLAVVDFLIDTHWKTTRDWPDDLDLCTVLYACCCPSKGKKNKRKITKKHLCAFKKWRRKKRSFDTRGLMTCQRLHEVDDMFFILLQSPKRKKPDKPLWSHNGDTSNLFLRLKSNFIFLSMLSAFRTKRNLRI